MNRSDGLERARPPESTSSEGLVDRIMGDKRILILIAAALATTAYLVSKTLDKGDEKPTQKIEEPAPPSEGKTRTLRDDSPAILYPQLPDTSTGDASTADTASGDDTQEVPELTLGEACQNLIDSQDGDEEGAVYQALSDITHIIEQQDSEISIYDLEKIANACKMTKKQMMAVLKTAIEQGNHKIAELIKHLI
jgi:hypothetical protein